MYVDSNVFIFAAADDGDRGEASRKIIGMIENDEISAASSYLTIDEVLWILQKNIGKEDALSAVKHILSLPLRWIDVKENVVIQALKVYDEEGTDPRDSFHLSSMKSRGLTNIISNDVDFDDVPWVKRVDVEEFVDESR